MNRQTSRNAFTLIELLTVMAIITLLIGILTPALGAARDRARSTAVRAQLNAMEVGLESFHGEEQKYPPSNANLFAKDPTQIGANELTTEWEVSDGTALLQGAHLIVDALVGRDFLGYDPKRTDSTANPPYNRWASANDRRQPYIPVDGVDVTSADKRPEDGFGKVPGGLSGGSNTFGDPQPTVDGLICRVFRDKFGWPILYYRANPSANQNTPIIQTGTNTSAANFGDGVFDGNDNAVFTSYDTTNCPGPALPASNRAHRICDAAQVYNPNYPVNSPGLQHRFAEFIRSLRASTYMAPPNGDLIDRPRPVKADRFILLSAGKDGAYGTLDDVANFQVLSTER
jgi:prepilin-type N-terminal cleavage/methylation domain-containing protein